MSLITDIADAIVADLNLQTFSKALVAVRLYDPEVGLEELVGGRVVVVPKDKVRTATVTRSLDQRDSSIDVAVQAKIVARPGEDTAEIDGWMDYTDEIEAFLVRLKPSQMPNVLVTGVQNSPVFSWDHLHMLRVFTSLLTVTVAVAWRRE